MTLLMKSPNKLPRKSKRKL